MCCLLRHGFVTRRCSLPSTYLLWYIFFFGRLELPVIEVVNLVTTRNILWTLVWREPCALFILTTLLSSNTKSCINVGAIDCKPRLRFWYVFYEFRLLFSSTNRVFFSFFGILTNVNSGGLMLYNPLPTSTNTQTPSSPCKTGYQALGMDRWWIRSTDDGRGIRPVKRDTQCNPWGEHLSISQLSPHHLQPPNPVD